MSRKFLIEGLEGGTRVKTFGDWRFRPLPRRVGGSRLKVTVNKPVTPVTSQSHQSGDDPVND